MTSGDAPTVTARMLIRRPVAEVFEAFVDPSVTTRFWFTKSSGRLARGRRVRWEWEMFGVGGDLLVEALEPNERILITWDDPPCPVEWRFDPRGDAATLVTITNWGFQGSRESVIAQAIDAKGGFTIVLAGLKAWLEHGVELHLVADQSPDDHIEASV